MVQPAADAPVLRAAGVNKRFGGLQALADVGVTIRRGQIYGLIGPNGSYVLDAEGKALVWDPVACCGRAWDSPTLADVALEGRYEVGGVACALRGRTGRRACRQ